MKIIYKNPDLNVISIITPASSSECLHYVAKKTIESCHIGHRIGYKFVKEDYSRDDADHQSLIVDFDGFVET